MRASEKELAKRIIVEIVRAAGGVLDNKTHLFKAFYHAHIHYAQNNRGYLSTWPIVRMPRGPGIDDAGTLLHELVDEGTLSVEPILKGNFTGFRFRVLDQRGTDLPIEAVASIEFGTQQVKDKSAADVSHASHVASRSWKEAKNGDRLNIYIDDLDEQTFQERDAAIRKIASVFQDAVKK